MHSDCLFLRLEVMFQLRTATEGQLAGRRPLPGSSPGAQLEHPAGHEFSALGNRDILAAIAHLTQAHQVKARESLLLQVIMQAAAKLIVHDPVNQRSIDLRDLERSLEPQMQLVSRCLFYNQRQSRLRLVTEPKLARRSHDLGMLTANTPDEELGGGE